jgi:multisubunit Na+/H+ antiporter MnhG subunit
LGEILLQVIFEFLAELGFHSLTNTLNRPKNATLSTAGFVLWGTMAGGISLLILPQSLISNLVFRKINVLVTPLVAGGVMMLIGRQRDKRGQNLVRLDRFGYAFVFALAMAVVRYVGTE